MESLLCRSNLCCSNISKTTYPSSNISKVAEISHNLKFITIFSYLLRGGIIWHINSIAGPTHVILDSAQPSFDLGAFFFAAYTQKWICSYTCLAYSTWTFDRFDCCFWSICSTAHHFCLSHIYLQSFSRKSTFPFLQFPLKLFQFFSDYDKIISLQQLPRISNFKWPRQSFNDYDKIKWTQHRSLMNSSWYFYLPSGVAAVDFLFDE